MKKRSGSRVFNRRGSRPRKQSKVPSLRPKPCTSPRKWNRPAEVTASNGDVNFTPSSFDALRHASEIAASWSVTICPRLAMPKSVYTDRWVRITIDIDDAEFIALNPWISATWNIGCQYNNINMPNNCTGAMSALGNGVHMSACGRLQPKKPLLHRVLSPLRPNSLPARQTTHWPGSSP
jgi:hypothetical protein